MRRSALSERNLDEVHFPLLLREFDHRMRNFLTMLEAAVMRTEAASVEDYRAKLMEPILGLRRLYQGEGQYYPIRELKALIEHAVSPYCVNGIAAVASGPDLLLEPNLALALHLVFHELALNAKKYGAFSSGTGHVEIIWKVLDLPGGGQKLELLWSESGGPAVTRPRRQGFGLRLVRQALEGHGGARIEFIPSGLSCFIISDLSRTPAIARGQVQAA